MTINDIDYSEEQLQVIQDLASVFMPIADIALEIDVDEEILKRDVKNLSSKASKAYRKGKVSAKIEIHRQDMKLAKSGSPLGIESIMRHLRDMEEAEI